jgi:CelD/BcsL family acetyltransferase involved in cellulose biosynthesis
VKIEALDRFDAIGEAGWQALVDRCPFPAPFLSWPWQTAWFEVFGDARPLLLLAVTDGAGELAAVLPLYEERSGRFAIVGGEDVTDYLDLIARAGAEEEAWQSLLQHRAALPAVWALRGIRAASPSAALLPAVAPAYGLTTKRDVEERCPVLELPETWDAYLAVLSGKNRHELLRKIRKFEREMPGAQVTCCASPADIADRVPAFLALHRRSRTGKARFMDSRMEAFFRRAIGALAERGQARLWLLEQYTRPLASFVCVEWPGSVGLYNSGFDPDAAGVSPGIVLLAMVIRDAIQRGIPRFDFLRGEERYKYAFGPHPEDLYRIEVAP